MPLQASSSIFTLTGIDSDMVGVLPDMRYASSIKSSSSSSPSDVIFAGGTSYLIKLLDAFGTPLAGSLQFARTGFFEVYQDPAVYNLKLQVLASGNILYSWNTDHPSNSQGAAPPATHAVIYNPTTFVLSPLMSVIDGYVSGFGSTFGTAKGLTSGRVALVVDDHNSTLGNGTYIFGQDIRYAVYNADGTVVRASTANSDTAGTQNDAEIVALSGGRFAILWTDTSGDSAGGAVEARIFAADGAPQGNDFQINVTESGNENNAAAASLGNGGFVAVWEDAGATGPDVGNVGVRARLFDANGLALSGEINVNTATAGDQVAPAVVGLPSGGFVAAWLDRGSGNHIVAQEFDAGGAKIGGELTLDAAASTFAMPALSLTPDGRVLVTWTTDQTATTGQVNAVMLDGRGAQYYGGSGNDYAMGADIGASANNVFVGNDGDDTYYALGGNDYGYMGAGADTFFGGAGVDVGLGGAGIDTLRGGGDQDYLFGGDGDDQIFGEDGVDVLQGEAGDDALNGGAGGDYFYGGPGNDTGYGGDGNDIFVMDVGNDLAFGDDGQDYFYMGAGDDVMFGGAGVDVMLGEAGNDTFDGGLGVDYLFLGPQGAGDNDTVILDKVNTGVEVVYNFEAGGTNDVIRLVGSGLTNFAQVQANISDYTASGGFCILTLDADTSVWFIGVAPNQLTSADFLFA